MSKTDIRCIQRFSNFKKALSKLTEVAKNRTIDNLSELEQDGLIHRFEYTYVLAWKTLQDLLEDKGYKDIKGLNPVIDQAFQDGYLCDSEAWEKMKKSRDLTSHTYNSETAQNIAEEILETYCFALKDLEDYLELEKYGK